MRKIIKNLFSGTINLRFIGSWIDIFYKQLINETSIQFQEDDLGLGYF